ncbi:MAG: glutamate synthase subunit beta [Bacteroidota bacterium]
MSKNDKHTGFLSFDRELPPYQETGKRVQHFQEFVEDFPKEKTTQQATRCMDCGVPFCHNACPLGNNIPAFNEAVYDGDWQYAYQLLDETNNFPEFTGRVCPAPCEKSCVLGINQPAVAIEHIEKTIVEEAYANGWVEVKKPHLRTGKKVAIVGSGPAGLAAAEQLNLAGHEVTVFEKDKHPGGLLRYGIPDFKLEKWIIERKISFMREAGIQFQCETEVGKDITAEELEASYDAVILGIGAPIPRDMPIAGRELEGVHFAMDYLTKQNQVVSGEEGTTDIEAKDKHVIVIGGGDTGSDCIGTANRQGATSITQITWGLKPPSERKDFNPWPEWPMILETSSSQEEGCERDWNILSKSFVADEAGKLMGLKVVNIEWNPGRKGYKEIEGSERILACDLALIAIGFQSADPTGLISQWGLETTPKGTIAANNFQTSKAGIFVAGDALRGASLVVWAIQEGRAAAKACDTFLMGESVLPVKDDMMMGV